jgi:DNA mismatch repair protein MutS2
VALDESRSILVISGPNTGGKTVALKTTGLLVMMGLAGLPVPALEARINRFRQVLADIGDHQSIAENLSTYSAHVLRVNEMISTLDPPSLILLDEVGAGTDPVYGASLGIAVIDHFRSQGAYVVATTHHQAIKQYATQTPQAVNSSVELDSETLVPTYRLRPGIAAGSSALEIAEQLGLPESILGHARQLLDDKEIQVEKYLSILRSEMESVRKSRESFEDRLEQLKEQESRLEMEFRKREQDRQRLAQKALDQWRSEFKKDADRVVKGISNRFEAAKMRKRLKSKEEQLRETFRRKMAVTSRSEEQPKAGVGRKEFAEQDWVYDSFFKKKGQVVELSSGNAVLLVDGKRIRTQLQHLTKIEKKKVVKRPSPSVRFEVVEDTDPELNLIGCTVDDALDQLDKFLDRAFLSQLHEVRIIHGFGTGRLKNAVSTFLRDHSQVVKFKVEGGATLAVLRE